MGDFGDAINNLYRQFILRDVLSFITPGAIIVFTALFLFFPELLSRSIHWLLYIPLFGIFYMVGFAVQCLGEILGLITTQGLAKSRLCQRLQIFGCNWADKSTSIIWWKETHKETVDFFEATSNKEWAQQQRERLVVLKQMCGNGFLAIVIAGVFLAANYCPWSHANPCIASLVAFMLLASLLWGHRIHLLRQDTMGKAILHKPENNKQES